MKKQITLKVIPLIVFAALSILAFASSTPAQGGPPMLTDDPATPGDGMWEVNFLSTASRGRTGWSLETPIVDLNYGLGRRIQLKLEAPWVVAKESGERIKTGPGNSMIGVKWRFLDEERHGFDVSIYPQLEFNNPTQSMARGLAEKGSRLFLPIEVARKVGSVEITGELGYRLVSAGPDEVEYGLLFARQVSRRLELMAELHGSSRRTFDEGELFFNAGSRIQLPKHTLLLISAGRTIRSPNGQGPQNIAAVGLQINFRMPGFRRHQ